MITSRTEWGQMIDFLRSNPWCSREEYMWRMTVPQVRLASYDFTHVEYRRDKKGKNKPGPKKIRKASDLVNDFGIPIIKNRKEKT